MGFLVNDGDKLTKELRIKKQQEAQEEYGLTPEEIANLKLPPKTEVECYSVTKIIQSRSKLSTVEKINLLIKLENALIDKLKKLHGKKRDIKKAEK
jgi:hypothetical protein